MYNRTTLLSSLIELLLEVRALSGLFLPQKHKNTWKYVQQNHTPVVSYRASPRGQSAVRFVSATETQEHVEVCTTEPHSCRLLAVFVALSSFSSRSERCQVCFTWRCRGVEAYNCCNDGYCLFLNELADLMFM